MHVDYVVTTWTTVMNTYGPLVYLPKNLKVHHSAELFFNVIWLYAKSISTENNQAFPSDSSSYFATKLINRPVFFIWHLSVKIALFNSGASIPTILSCFTVFTVSWKKFLSSTVYTWGSVLISLKVQYFLEANFETVIELFVWCI